MAVLLGVLKTLGKDGFRHFFVVLWVFLFVSFVGFLFVLKLVCSLMRTTWSVKVGT